MTCAKAGIAASARHKIVRKVVRSFIRLSIKKIAVLVSYKCSLRTPMRARIPEPNSAILPGSGVGPQSGDLLFPASQTHPLHPPTVKASEGIVPTALSEALEGQPTPPPVPL